MKKRNKAHQVRRNDPALDKRKHKRLFLGPEATSAGKMAKKKSTRQGLPLRILQLNVEGLTASKLDIVERLATQHSVKLEILSNIYLQVVVQINFPRSKET